MTSTALTRPALSVFRGDNLAVLPTLSADSVQLVITSPGYGVGWDYADGGAADSLPLEEYLRELGRAAWLIEREPSYWPDLEALAAA
jgi:hypothetical protein